ncbi:hypothetical protein D3C86_2027070 [compost metagenome]
MKVSEIFPQSSVTVQVLVYVPAFEQEPEATNCPLVFTTFKTSASHKSEAVGNNACADAKADKSLHSKVKSNSLAVVVHVGFVVS